MQKSERALLTVSLSHFRPSLSPRGCVRFLQPSHLRPSKRANDRGQQARVYSWGVGAFGGLGFGDLQDQELPFPIRELDGQQITEIAAAWRGCLAAGTDGRVWKWGWEGSMRSLLSASRLRRSSPQMLKFLQSLPFGGASYSAIIRSPERLELFGSHPDLKVVSVAGGTEHVAAVTNKGAVFTWGSGFHGQLGHGGDYMQTFSFEPRLVEALKHKHIVQVACGYTHTLFLTREGEVFSCGRVYDGSLGIKGLSLDFYEKRKNLCSPLNIREYDTQIDGLNKSYKIVKVAAGFRHSVCLDDKGNIWVCGKNSHGQLGLVDLQDRKIFTKVSGIERIIDIAAGQFHTLALTADRKVITWGANRHGQCGRNDDDNAIMHEVDEGTELNQEPKLPSEARLSVAKSLLPGEPLLPALVSAPARVFAGGLESAIITEDGECVLFGSGHELNGRVKPYLALTDVSVQQVAFGYNTSHALGTPRAPLTPPPPAPAIK